MIKLTDLLKEESFTATSNKSGETSVFKSKDSRDAAVKAGTHSKIKDKEDSEEKEPKGDKPNMFSKDTGYDAGDKKSEPKKTQGKLSKFIYGDDDKKPDVVAKPEGKPDLSKYSTADEDWYTKDAASISTIYNDKLTIDDLQNVFKAKGYGDVTDTTLDDIVDRYNDDEDMRDRFKDNGISKGKLTKRIKDLKAQLKSGGTKSEPSKSEPSKYDSKYFADSDGYSDKDDPNEPFYPDTDGSPSIGTKRTEIRLDKIETALDADLKLDNLGFKTARSSGAGGGQFEGPLEIIDKDADYDNGFTALSIGSGENDGNFSMGFLNQDGEPLFGDDSYSITPDDDISSEEAFELGKTLMKMPEVQKFLKGKISKDEFKPTYDKIQSKFSGKSEPKNESLSEGKSYQNRFKHLANIN